MQGNERGQKKKRETERTEERSNSLWKHDQLRVTMATMLSVNFSPTFWPHTCTHTHICRLLVWFDDVTDAASCDTEQGETHLSVAC